MKPTLYAALGATPGWKHIAALAACLLAFAGPAQAIVAKTNADLLSGSGQPFLDGVAKLIITGSEGTFGCSGSLLTGGTSILTAAHCVTGADGAATTSNIAVSLLGGTVTASSNSYVVDPGWNGSLLGGNDLALIHLSQPIASITGYGLYFASAQNSTVVLAGYGYTGNGTTGSVSGTFGTLHYGSNQYDGADPSVSAIYLYDFDNGTPGFNKFGSLGLGSAEVLIAPGDSGGPGLIEAGGHWYVAGVHSFDSCSRGTCPINSSFGEVAGDISVFGQSAWLQSVTAPVPEPETYAMLMAGLGLVAAFAMRRRVL